MKKLVKLFGVRHGANDGDKLTDEGRQQIINSMLNNAKAIGPKIDAVFTSLRVRTMQSAAAASISNAFKKFPDWQKRAGFDYYGAPVQQSKKFNQAVNDLKGDGLETIGTWEQAAPEWTEFLKPKVSMALTFAVIELAVKFDKEVITGLIFSHSPTIDLPAGSNFPRLRPADIVQYSYIVETDDAGEIISLELAGTYYLPRD